MKYITPVACVIITILVMNFYFGCRDKKYQQPISDTTQKVSIQYIPSEPIIKHDTLPPIFKTIPVEVIPAGYVPSKVYDSLLNQYTDLLKEFLAINQYQDSIKSDSNLLVLTQSLQKNRILNLSYAYYPYNKIIETTNDIITPEIKKRKGYLMLGVGGKYYLDNYAVEVEGGFSYQDRKDRFYTIKVCANTFNQYGIGFQRNFKLSFK